MKARDYKARHFLWSVDDDGVALLTLNRPERKNPLTFDSYAEMRDLFRALVHADDCKVVIVTGAGGNFSSGGDVHEIIGPLTEMDMPELLDFTRMTGDLVKAMRGCPQPIIAALDGVCVGAGAIMAMASDLRIATPRTKTAFLFTRVGLAGFVRGVAMRRSEAMAIMAPAPTQTPSSAAMTGCGQPRIALTRSPVMRVKSSSSGMAISVSGPMISCTSPPEEKLPPAPVTITTLQSRAWTRARNRSRSSA